MRRKKYIRTRSVRIPKPKPVREDLWMMGGFVVIGYIIFSLFAYSLMNPDQTQMQVWLSIWEALTWSW